MAFTVGAAMRTNPFQTMRSRSSAALMKALSAVKLCLASRSVLRS